MIINILKKFKYIPFKLIIILTGILIFSIDMNAKSSSKRSGQSRQKKVRGQSKKSSGSGRVALSSGTTLEAEKTNQNVTPDTSGITKYNCENTYFNCMNKTCYSDTNGRCSCNVSSKFNEANKSCEYITDLFPSLKDDIIASYQRMAKSDCASFAIQDVKQSETALSNIAYRLIECLEPKCRRGRDEKFINCFDEDNLQKKLQLCEKIYKDASDKDAVIEMVYKSMDTYKTKYCNDVFGTMKDGKCHLQIGIGPSYKAIKKTMDFVVGDVVICSEKNFGVDLGESKHQKIRHIKEIALFGVDVVKNAVGFAADIVDMKDSSANSDKFDKVTNGITMGLGGLSVVTDSQHLGGAIGGMISLKNEDFSYQGHCYAIKDGQTKELFDASDDYYYKLRWTENWSDVMMSADKLE